MSTIADQRPVYDDDDERSSATIEFTSWLVSLIAHATIIVVLGTMWLAPHRRSQPQLTAALTPEERETDRPEVLELQKYEFSNLMASDIGSLQTAGIEIPASVSPNVSDISELHSEEIVVADSQMQLPVVLDLSTAPLRGEKAMLKGSAGVGAVGAVGAVDRITQEILLSLEQRPTLVVWIFDQSGSMQAQREAVNGRFNRVYDELGLSRQVGGKKGQQPLLTSVMAFGGDIHFLTKQPTDDLDAIRAAVDSIPNDESGVERVFTAVGSAAEKYQSYRVQGGRNVMIIVFSDEVGDDDGQLDAAIHICRRNAMPVYVVGVPAPFGRAEIEVKYVDPDPQFDQTPRWIPVRQGPETLLPEVVQLGFTGRRNRDDELYRLDSGFGPYCLTRLCVETGGIYFAVHPHKTATGGFVRSSETPAMSARINYFFDEAIMRSYAPNYLPNEQMQRLIASNKARAALVQAAQMSMVMPMDQPRRVFQKGEDEAAFKRLLDEAQKAAAVLEPKLNALYSVLKLGEPDRPKLTEARWQAGFDLSMGRVLAHKVRTEAYNAMLAKAKLGMKFQDPKNNTWELVPADEISVGSATEKQAKLAREYLNRAAQEHAGTPWALLAKTELETPIGWKWTERFTPPPAPPRPPQPNNNGNGTPRPQPPRPAAPPKPVRQVKL